MLCHIFWSQVEYKIVCFICVIELDYNNIELEKVKIKDVNRYHYFKVEETGIRAWEFQGIGHGKLLQLQDVNLQVP